MNNQKHLTISDRIYIEQELLQGSSFKAIGSALHKDPTTIAKEVKNRRTLVPGNRSGGNCRMCKYWSDCNVRGGESVIRECPVQIFALVFVGNAGWNSLQDTALCISQYLAIKHFMLHMFAILVPMRSPAN